MPIHLLPDEVASQIAAGEVVERPASVIKELLENSLDAGAREISILVENAGKSRMEVSDDGSGIPFDELLLAVERHATSKLTRAEELFQIKTLGFRGEALASIGSVSRLTLTSRSVDEEVGARVRVDGGHPGSLERVGTPNGTVVQVEGLFYNVPARLKFLKQDATERQQIDSLVTRYAVEYPEVRFKLFEDGRPVLQTSGNGDRREVLSGLYGVETARQLLEVSSQDEGITIRGFITPISITRSNRREITFFINGRWVADTPLTAAMTQAYHTLLMVGRYPMGFLSIQLPPDDVDVNVHPAKAEVRFRSPDKIFSSLQRAVRRALLAYTPVPSIYHPSLPWNTSSPQAPFNSVWPASMGASGEGFPTVQSAQPELDPDVDGILEPVPQTGQQNAFPGSSLGLLRWVGQIGAAYLVAEGPDGLYLIDQHAAHERVLFERYMAQLQQKILSQGLLQPAAVHLPPHSAALLTDQLELLGQLGFSIEAFGPNTFLVRAIPALLGQVDPAAALSVLVEDFEEDETPLKNEVEARLIARICKRVAVKAGQVLSPDEQKILIRDLENCRSPRTCPHGRPTMIHLSVDLLERQFGRRGSR